MTEPTEFLCPQKL